MTRHPERGRRPWRIGGPLLLASMLAVPVLVWRGPGSGPGSGPPPFLVNESPSVPRGLYLRTWSSAPTRGVLVALRPPARARAYLSALGMPENARLLKRVAATDGDLVCRRGDVIVAGDRRVVVRRQDRRGARLESWTGCRRLGRDERFLLGDTPASYDSRYFGPVRVSDLDGVYRERWRW